MRVNVAPRHANSGRQNEGKRFAAHTQWLRGRACIIATRAGHDCSGRIEAAHFDGAGGKGMGMKVSDVHCFPACSEAHAELHRIGQETWQAKWKVDLAAATKAYARMSPHRHLWEHDDAR